MAVRVLIVDDSLSARELIRHHLERLGCKMVAQADNAALAVSLFKLVRPDLVTLDVVMPHVDGIDALTALRMIRHEDPQMPVLIVSALPFKKTRETFLQEGAFDYVQKPFGSAYFGQVRRTLQKVFPELRSAPLRPTNWTPARA